MHENEALLVAKMLVYKLVAMCRCQEIKVLEVERDDLMISNCSLAATVSALATLW